MKTKWRTKMKKTKKNEEIKWRKNEEIKWRKWRKNEEMTWRHNEADVPQKRKVLLGHKFEKAPLGMPCPKGEKTPLGIPCPWKSISGAAQPAHLGMLSEPLMLRFCPESGRPRFHLSGQKRNILHLFTDAGNSNLHMHGPGPSAISQAFRHRQI